MANLVDNDIEPIDLVVCNLYRSPRTVGRSDRHRRPAMVRAPRRNHQHVGVLTSRATTGGARGVNGDGLASNATRHELARAAFAHGRVRPQIVRWLDGGGVVGEGPRSSTRSSDDAAPDVGAADVVARRESHQIGARYRLAVPRPGGWRGQARGSALSYLISIRRRRRVAGLVHELKDDFPGFSCVRYQARQRVGCGVGSSLDDAFAKALAATRRALRRRGRHRRGRRRATRRANRRRPQADVIIASSFAEEALNLVKPARPPAAHVPRSGGPSAFGAHLWRYRARGRTRMSCRSAASGDGERGNALGQQLQDLRWVGSARARRHAIVLAATRGRGRGRGSSRGWSRRGSRRPRRGRVSAEGRGASGRLHPVRRRLGVAHQRRGTRCPPEARCAIKNYRQRAHGRAYSS